ncbi:MAG: hypothetical protein AAF297_11215 [Planctomycetota bacterium]
MRLFAIAIPGKVRAHRRSVGALVMLLPFLAAQLAWLPLGAVGGMNREVALWSNCGEALCDCLPAPACAMCPSGEGAACVETKTDSSESRELQVRIASLLSGLVAVPVDRAAGQLMGDGAYPLLPAAVELTGPRSRSLDPQTPPPWA